jgi:hypothetical protein
VSVARARLEARPHARRQAGAARIGVQGRVTLHNELKLVLLGVGMAQGRDCARCKLSQIDAEIGQTEQIAQRTLLAALHLCCERLRIVGRLDALGGVKSDNCNGRCLYGRAWRLN